MTPRRLAWLAVLSLAVLVPPEHLSAQEEGERQEAMPRDSTAVLVGTIRSEMTGHAVPEAQVYLRSAQRGAMTDSTGKFRLADLPPGRDTLVIRYVGFDPKSTTIDLAPRRVTRATFILSETVFEVADIQVDVRRLNTRDRAIRDRIKRGHGAYVTREDIQERQPELLSDMLRGIPRVDVRPYRGNNFQKILLGRGTMACEPQYYVDGTLRNDFTLDRLAPEEIDVIEIYRSPAEVPVQFKMDMSRCGTIVVWTRTGGPGNPWDSRAGGDS